MYVQLKKLLQNLKKSKSSIRRLALWWETTKVENLLEDLAFLLKSTAFFDVINLLASLTLIFSLVSWWTGREEQWENKIFETWAIINNADKDSSGVVKVAIERLHKEGFSLQGFKLNGTNLKGANLANANLKGTNLANANLANANLKGANLKGANLKGANLKGANLKGTILINTENGRDNSQIKSACFWEKTIYKGSKDDTTEQWIVDDEANKKYIQKLKQDQSSDSRKKKCRLF